MQVRDENMRSSVDQSLDVILNSNVIDIVKKERELGSKPSSTVVSFSLFAGPSEGEDEVDSEVHEDDDDDDDVDLL